jgi:hypothetical protein
MGVLPTSWVMSLATPVTGAGVAAELGFRPASVTRVLATRLMNLLLHLLLLLLVVVK